MGICVTGQLQRLELQSKLDNLVEANAQEYTIDLVVIVDPHQSVYINENTFLNSSKRGLSSWNKQRAVQAMEKSSASVSRLVLWSQPTDPPLQERYVAELSDRRHSSAKRRKRAQVHVRQWATLSMVRMIPWYINTVCSHTRYAPLAIFSAIGSLRRTGLLTMSTFACETTFW
jgi:hypothetical protein